DVEHVAAGTGHDLHRTGRSGDERNELAGVGLAVRAGLHGPDAVAGVVGEEQRAVVGARVGAAVFEGQAGYRRAAGRACVGRNDLGRVVVGVVRRIVSRVSRGVQRFAEIEVGAVVAALPRRTLVARPTEVLRDRVVPDRNAVDFLPGVPAYVA